MKLNSIIFLLTVVVVVSCRKDNPVPIAPPPVTTVDTIWSYTENLDTIYSSEYLMHYPGSWWEFDNGKIDSCLAWEFRETYSNSQSGNSYTINQEKVLTSHVRINRNDNPIDKYSRGNTYLHLNEQYSTTWVKEISTSGVGDYWQLHPFQTGGEHPHGYTIKVYGDYHTHLDSLSAGGTMYYDIACVSFSSQIYYHHLGSGPTSWTHNYYAKDIGLIKQIRDNPIYSILEVIDLVDYYIAPH